MLMLMQKQLGKTVSVSDLPTGGSIGTAAATIDSVRVVSSLQSTALKTLTFPAPTDTTSALTILFENNGSVSLSLYNSIIPIGTSIFCFWNPVSLSWSTDQSSVALYSSVETGTQRLFGPLSKQIYRKVVSFTNKANASVLDATLTSTYMTTIISMSGYYIETTSTYPFPYASPTVVTGNVTAHATASGLILDLGTSRSTTNSGAVIIEYTK